MRIPLYIVAITDLACWSAVCAAACAAAARNFVRRRDAYSLFCVTVDGFLLTMFASGLVLIVASALRGGDGPRAIPTLAGTVITLGFFGLLAFAPLRGEREPSGDS